MAAAGALAGVALRHCRSRHNCQRLARPSRVALEEAATRLASMRAAVSRGPGVGPYRARGRVSLSLQYSERARIIVRALLEEG